MVVLIEYDQEIDLNDMLSEVLGTYDPTPEEKENPELFVNNYKDSLIQDCIDELDNQAWNIKYSDGCEDDYRRQIEDELKEDYVLDYIKEFFD